MSDLYCELILDHWRNPRYSEVIDDADYEGELVNESCGDTVYVQLKFDEGKITNLSIRVSGCALSTAAGSLLAEAIINKKNVVIKSLTDEKMFQILGLESSISRRGCVMLALEGVKKLLR